MKTYYYVKVCLENGQYATLSVKGKTRWKTKKTARKHAYEYKATWLRDSWVEEEYGS